MADKNYLDSDGVLYLWQKIKAKITDAVKNKVDKVNGKGLSTNDYTTAEKTKLAGSWMVQINMSILHLLVTSIFQVVEVLDRF